MPNKQQIKNDHKFRTKVVYKKTIKVVKGQKNKQVTTGKKNKNCS